MQFIIGIFPQRINYGSYHFPFLPNSQTLVYHIENSVLLLFSTSPTLSEIRQLFICSIKQFHILIWRRIFSLVLLQTLLIICP